MFKNLDQFQVKADVARPYSMDAIAMNDKTPVLMVKPATEGNKSFARAQLTRSNKRMKTSSARGVTLEALDSGREDDRTLYPRFIITGWENVFDDEGNLVEYTTKNCEEFLAAIPNWVFDDMRAWCSTPGNFAGGVDNDAVGN
jgi:hypothetical protein